MFIMSALSLPWQCHKGSSRAETDKQTGKAEPDGLVVANSLGEDWER